MTVRWISLSVAAFVVAIALAAPGWADDGERGENPGRGSAGGNSTHAPERQNQGENASHNESRDSRGGDRPESREGDDDEEDGDEDDDDEDEEDDDDESRGGRLQVQHGTSTGQWISFESQDCTIQDLTLGDVLLVEEVQLQGACSNHTSGAKLDLVAQDDMVRLHDSPNALMRLQAEDSEIRVRLPQGVNVTPTERGFDLTLGEHAGRFSHEGGLQWDGASTFTLVDGDARFWAHPHQGDSDDDSDDDEVRRAVSAGVDNRRVGGEIAVLLDDGTVTHEVLAYDDVAIEVSKRDDSSYRVLLDGNLTEGRTFVLHLSPGAFRHDQVAVRYFDVDGDRVADEVTITKATDLEDVLEILPEEGPEYWIVKDAAGLHVLVAVPHWSVHLFEIQGIPPEIVPIVAYGVAFGIVFVAFAAFGMFIGRKRPAPA